MTVTAPQTFKPRDVEELVDFYVHRRAAAVLVKVLAPTPITPNQVTVLSGLVAILAGLVLATSTPSRPWQPVLAAAIFFLSIVLDCADGQLARLRRQSSFAGRALDGYTDVVSITSIMVGHLFWLLNHGCPFWVTQVVGWSAGLSFKWHAHTYDHIKNLYLFNTAPPGSSDIPSFPSYEDIEREREEHARNGRWFSALLCRGFRHFTESQRRGIDDRIGLGLPQMQTDAERALYREHFRGFMRLWTFNGVGTHLALYVVMTALAPLYPYAPLVAWGIVAGPMNLFTLFLKLREPQLEARVREELAAASARQVARA
jgi:hypothetical protein